MSEFGNHRCNCKLPSDHLTSAELKKRCGEVTTYKLNAPMKWDAFNKMPDDLKREYVEGLQKNYGATDAMMARMFCIHSQSVFDMRKKLGISAPNRDFLPRDQMERRTEVWEAFCEGREPPPPAPKREEEPVHPTEKNTPVTKKPVPVPRFVDLTRVGAEFIGPFHAESLVSWLMALPIRGTETVRIRVEVERI